MAESATHRARVLQDFQDDLLAAVRVASAVEHRYLRPAAAYLLELTLFDYCMLAFPAPMLAAASVLLARTVVAHLMPRRDGRARRRRAVLWPQALAEHAGYAAAALEAPTRAMFELTQAAVDEDGCPTQVVVRRYAADAFERVSELPLPSSLHDGVFAEGMQYHFPVEELGEIPVASPKLGKQGSVAAVAAAEAAGAEASPPALRVL
jgi:Cyclin, C-terminal domain